ncbi:hypothetical protein [Granulicella mallensis]|uniref:Uncharacterized protein n=1 Tax=Granulicella mallensis (strain ATCC BAA-1857 / DSM 23137 / MP5ACTX8) TaxID=682795 RepID=G8NYP2_GRAMM|nr:hypothetical protein [Granulicella mallensis]AEU39101.1 hypothetical protein AciX8_4832 [Granulicella mallensis MP5ACTX8]
MDNASPVLSIAEWTLAAVSSKERAAEVVGDHLEQHGSIFSLWLSILRIAFARQWRWLIALPAAGLAGAPALAPYTTMWVAKDFAKGFAEGFAGSPQTQVSNSLSQPMDMALTGLVLASVAVCLWSVSALALLRYGLRSPIARLSGVLATLFTLGSCCMGGHHVLAFVLPVLAVVVALALVDSQGRRVLGCITLAGTAFWGAFLLIATTLARIVLIGGAREANAVALTGYTLCLLAEACVLAQSRRWLRLA